MAELIDIPLIGSLDESNDGKVTAAPALVTLRNLERAAGTERALTKRRGTTRLAANHTSGLTGPSRLIPHGDQLLAFDATGVYTYQDSTDNFHRLANSPKATIASTRPVAAYAAEDVVATGCAATDDFIVYAWTTRAVSASTVYHIHAQVVDRATGAPSNISTQIPNSLQSDNDHGVGAKSLRVFKAGTAVYVVFGTRGASGNDRVSYVRVTDANGPSGGYWTSPTLISTGCQQANECWMDAGPHTGTGDYWIVAWVGDGSATDIKIVRYSGTTQSAGPTTITAQNIGTRRVAVVGSLSSNTYALYVLEDAATAASSGLKRWTLTESNTTSQTATATPSAQFDAGGITACKKSSTTTAVLVSRVGAVDNCRVYVDTVTGTSVWTDEMATQMYDLVPESKPFIYGTDTDQIYFVARYWTSAANNYNALAHVDMSETEPVALLDAYFNSGVAANTTGPACASVAELGSGSFEFVVRTTGRVSDPKLTGDPTTSTQVVDQIKAGAIRLAFDAPDRFISTELGGYVFTSGGILSQFDGARFVELGFANFPDMDTSDYVAATTGGSLVAGTYLYACVYEWWDALGNRHQSASKVVSVTVGGTTASKVTITIPPVRQSRKRIKLGSGAYDDGRSVTAALYRSTVDGDTLYRLEGASGQLEFPELVEYISTYTYVDTYSDAQLALNSRELLYTSSGGANELQNFPFPACSFITAHQDRLWGIRSEDPSTMAYSKYAYPGVAIAWNPSLLVTFQDPLVAAVSQDGNLIAFGERSIYTVRDRVTDNTGSNTTYDPPVLLSSEMGCLQPRSVVASPVGVFFMAPGGLYVLPRGGAEPQYIGGQIERTLETYPTIVAAVHLQERQQVRFAAVTATGSSGEGRVLVYDYGAKQWYVWDYGEIPMSDLAAYQGDMLLGIPSSTSDHKIWREDTGYDDPTGYYGTTLETGDFRLGGLTGTGVVRFVRFLAERLGTCTVRVEESTDSGETWPYSHDWDLPLDEPEVVRRYAVVRRKASRHRFRLTELSAGVADSQGVRYYGLSLDAHPSRGGARLRSAHRS